MMTRRGLRWLSATAEDPDHCQATWAADPRHPYVLPSGRYFDVVALDQRVGMETFDQLVRHQMPMGPVMVDWAARRIGFFLPSGSRERFSRMVDAETTTPPGYRYLDHGSVVVVPGPMPLTGDRYSWLCAPKRRPEVSFARIAALAAMFVAASALVARADRYDEDHRSSAGVPGIETAGRVPSDGR